MKFVGLWDPQKPDENKCLREIANGEIQPQNAPTVANENQLLEAVEGMSFQAALPPVNPLAR